MPKKKLVYYCKECGFESSKWMGQCPGCKEWNTFVEEPVVSAKPAASSAGLNERAKPFLLREISAGQEDRHSSGFGELDRVLGGGIVPGSLVLVG